MKRSTKLLLGLSIATLGFMIWSLVKEINNDEYDAEKIADEGYETAHDILFPYQDFQTGKNLHFGPVLPG